MNDSEIIETLIDGYAGMRSRVAATPVTHLQVVQHEISDWDFLVMRAELVGFGVVCNNGEIDVRPAATSASAAGKAVFGEGLLSAELELDAAEQLGAVDFGAWSPANQEWLSARSEDAESFGPGDVSGNQLAGGASASSSRSHPGAVDVAELEQWANAEMGRIRRAAVRGKVRIQGSAELFPGTLLELGGLGKRFNGLAFVSAVRHHLGKGDWISEVSIGASPKTHAERFPVSACGVHGSTATVHGLQIGKVIALAGDPAGEDRIQLRLVSVGDGSDPLWARQALLDAGNARGTSFRPEIGDEVVVGFLGADFQHPVILGGLHSSAQPNAVTGNDDNHDKAIVTRAGMRIHWSDDKVACTIDTPAGNRIVLSEREESVLIQDQHKNRMELNTDGIELESSGQLRIKARGDVRIEGRQIELSAKTILKASGTSSAEFSAQGNTVVKGKLVQIN